MLDKQTTVFVKTLEEERALQAVLIKEGRTWNGGEPLTTRLVMERNKPTLGTFYNIGMKTCTYWPCSRQDGYDDGFRWAISYGFEVVSIDTLLNGTVFLIE